MIKILIFLAPVRIIQEDKLGVGPSLEYFPLVWLICFHWEKEESASSEGWVGGGQKVLWGFKGKSGMCCIVALELSGEIPHMALSSQEYKKLQTLGQTHGLCNAVFVSVRGTRGCFVKEHVCLLWCQPLKVRGCAKYPELLSLGTESFYSVQWNWHIEPGRSVLCEWPVTGCFVNCKAYFAKWYQQRHVKPISIPWLPDIHKYTHVYNSRWTHWKSVEWARAILFTKETQHLVNGEDWG